MKELGIELVETRETREMTRTKIDLLLKQLRRDTANLKNDTANLKNDTANIPPKAQETSKILAVFKEKERSKEKKKRKLILFVF